MTWPFAASAGAAFDAHTDDTQAWMRAFEALRPKGGILVLPAGTSRTSRPLFVPNDTIVQGQGREVTKIVNQASVVFRIGQFESFVPVPGGPFPKLQGVRVISFRDLTIESQAPRGGHIFEMVGYTSAICCSWTHLFLRQFNPAKQIFRHFSTPAGGGFQDSLWEHLFMFHGDPVRGINPSVPAFEMSGPAQLVTWQLKRN